MSIAAIWTWLSTNWTDAIKWAVIGAVAWFAYSALADFRQMQKDCAKWESNYKTTKQNLEVTEKSLKQLEQEKKNIEDILKRREERIGDLEKETKDAKDDIRKLEVENAEIRVLLNTRIPDQLWRKIFPARDSNRNETGQSAGARQPPATVPGTP